MIKQAESRTIKRSQIKLANYNPRKIKSVARDKLTHNIKERGLMGGLVWNERSGNLVSGHQRVAIADKLQKYDTKTHKNDYNVTVSVVDLDDIQEKEQNIFFNNAEAQGEYDDELLKNMMKGLDFSLETGFSKQDNIKRFSVTELTDEEYRKIAERVEKLTNQFKQSTKQVRVDNNNFYMVVVFRNGTEQEAFARSLGVTLDDGRFISSELFIKVIIDWVKDNDTD